MLFSRRTKRKTTEATPVHYPPTGTAIHSSPPLSSSPPPYSAHYSQSAYQLPLGTPPPPPRRPPGIPALPAVPVPAPLRLRRTSPQSVTPVYQQPSVHQREWSSSLDLPSAPVSGVPSIPPISDQTTGHSNVTVHDKVADKFGHIISLIDEEAFGGESELLITLPQAPDPVFDQSCIRGGNDDLILDRALLPSRTKPKPGKQTNVFSKLDSYLNSRLPNSLPPLRVYLPTYPLLCLAAKYSASAYQLPSSAGERKDFVSANTHTRAKAMVIKSVPIDDKKTIVFAIRGTSMLSLHDWGINLSTQPVSPAGFLDDAGNLCHSGFLKVAKAMVGPIAIRLRQLLQENPSRSACSLLLTGHSAGGAVAALLYSHMLSSTVSSELSVLTGCFKRVHCVTFGAPPVSLLPLQKPDRAQARLRKCIFFSLMNEGDPVVRAEKAYVRSLIDLLACPNPHRADQCHKCSYIGTTVGVLQASMSKLDLSLKPNPKKNDRTGRSYPHHHGKQKFWWDVPTAILSNAGRLIVLRVPKGRQGKKAEEDAVTANIVSDEQLRKVIFGDPLMHSMGLYQERVEALAVRAVTGRLLD
ncbi:hypothetical protein DV736_g4945, partial [Chaetothyriales sp. CBS 134916]